MVLVAGLVMVAILILIPVVLISRILVLAVLDYAGGCGAESRKISQCVSSLGEFQTYDSVYWNGEVSGLQVSIRSNGQAPSEKHAQPVLALLADRDVLTAKARTFLVAHRDASSFPGGADAFECIGLDYENSESFLLAMFHPDQDGAYLVEFNKGEPVSAGLED